MVAMVAATVWSVLGASVNHLGRFGVYGNGSNRRCIGQTVGEQQPLAIVVAHPVEATIDLPAGRGLSGQARVNIGILVG
jgi:hypothetical protein